MGQREAETHQASLDLGPANIPEGWSLLQTWYLPDSDALYLSPKCTVSVEEEVIDVHKDREMTCRLLRPPSMDRICDYKGTQYIEGDMTLDVISMEEGPCTHGVPACGRIWESEPIQTIPSFWGQTKP